jgi:hypothetical protein
MIILSITDPKMMRKTGKAEPWAAAPNRPMIVYSFA